MTNTTGGTTPAGWYPVTPGSSQLRWWDGAAWTDHVHDQAIAQVGGALKAPAGTNPNTLWVWILAVLPLLGLASLFLFNPASYFQSMMSSAGTDPTNPLQAETALFTSPGYVLLVVLGFVTYAITVLFAALDWRQLKALGVPKPFHWAWAFLPSGYGQLVYMIGRFVIVKRRTGTGLAPLWVWIATIVVVFVIAGIWAISLFASLGSMIANLPTT